MRARSVDPPIVRLRSHACHAAHWGYVITGELVVTYTDGNTERCTTGDVFHWPAGHSVRADDDVEMILFSPQVENSLVIEHVAAELSTV